MQAAREFHWAADFMDPVAMKDTWWFKFIHDNGPTSMFNAYSDSIDHLFHFVEAQVDKIIIGLILLLVLEVVLCQGCLIGVQVSRAAVL